jgi:hypothetical protein
LTGPSPGATAERDAAVDAEVIGHVTDVAVREPHRILEEQAMTEDRVPRMAGHEQIVDPVSCGAGR